MKPVTLDHFTEYRFPSQLRSNQKGAVAFLAKQANLEENCYHSDLWILENNTARQLTFDHTARAIFWKDEQTILLARAQQKKDIETIQNGIPLTILQKLCLKKAGEAEEWLRLPYEISDLVFLSENKFLFLANFDPALNAILEKAEYDPEKAALLLKEDSICEVLTELPFWENGSGFTKDQRQRLYLYDNGNVKPLVDERTNILQLRVSDDKTTAFYTCENHKAKASITDKLYVLNLTTLEREDISIEQDFSHSQIVPVSADCLVVFGTNMKKHGLNENGAFFKIEIAQRSTTVLYDKNEYDGWDPIGTDLKMPAAPRWFGKGNTVYWIGQKGDSSQIFSIDITNGDIHHLTSQKGCVSELVFDGKGIVFSAMRKLQGPELYRYEFDYPVEEQITQLNPLAEEFTFSVPEPFPFTNQEGNSMRAWVIKPVHFNASHTYPAILVIHGGPKTSYGSVLMHEMQYWANQGYGVFFCNPTGSTGQKDDFGDLRERYGLIDFDDLMLFTDLVLEQNSWIDPELLGVTGGSYGGFMTNWIIGHTDRFKTAVSERSISNWATMETVSDIGYYFIPDQTGASIWNDPQSIWEQSPLKYAINVKTPTLFIHSDEDYRCPLVEGIQMYSALQYFKIETKLCIFKGQNHELTRNGAPKSRMRRLKEITEWFDNHLKIDT